MSSNSLIQAVQFLPEKIKYPISILNNKLSSQINEIRLKRMTPVMLVTSKQRLFLKNDGSTTNTHTDSSVLVVENHDMDDAVRRLCNFSIHAFQSQMKNGYITVAGGHRVGISASAVTNADGEITAIKNVSSLNIRISRDIAGAADEIIKKIFCDKVRSLLVVGEPLSGKTTVLRDIARRLSGEEFGYLRVTIVDERSEIAATNEGICSNFVGIACDVLDGFPKADGMMIALRGLSPDVIVCDEIGSSKDVYAIENVSNAGTYLIASIHAEDFTKLLKRQQFQNLMRLSSFDVAVILKGRTAPGEIKEIIPLKRYWR